MSEQPNKTKRIEDYLGHQLKGQELDAFKEQLATDPGFKAEVNQQSNLQKGIEAYGERALKHKLEAIHKDAFPQKSGASFSLPRWIAVAASLLIVALMTWWWMMAPPGETDLFEAYYAPYPIPFASRNNETDRIILQAGTYYKADAFEKAQPLFEQIQKTNPANANVALAVGICYLETQNIPLAQSAFLQIINSPEQDIYHNLAQWYLALTFLKENRMEEAKKWLQPLVDNPSADKHSEAQSLLNAIQQ